MSLPVLPAEKPRRVKHTRLPPPVCEDGCCWWQTVAQSARKRERKLKEQNAELRKALILARSKPVAGGGQKGKRKEAESEDSVIGFMERREARHRDEAEHDVTDVFSHFERTGMIATED